MFQNTSELKQAVLFFRQTKENLTTFARVTDDLGLSRSFGVFGPRRIRIKKLKRVMMATAEFEMSQALRAAKIGEPT